MNTQTDNQTTPDQPLRDAACSPSDFDPYEREAAKAAIHTLQRDLHRERKRYSLLESDYANLRETIDVITSQRNDLEWERDHWENVAKEIMKDYLSEGREKDQEITRLKLLLENAKCPSTQP